MDSESIDLTVTSPPYDNLRTYNGMNDWNADKWRSVIAELHRVTRDGGVVVWVVGDATVKGSETGTSFMQALWAMECGFRLHDTMIWNKPNVLPLTHNRYEQAFEFMFVWSKGRPNNWNGIKDKVNVGAGRAVTGTRRESDGSTKKLNGAGTKSISPLGLRHNVWNIETAKGAKSHNHPAPFPESLARDHILSWSNPGDTVFDPFLGSGTTAKMALTSGRGFIGIEREPEYFAMAKERCKPYMEEDIES